MNNNLDQALDYVIIPRRNFTRYVLTYEVLPLSLCYRVNYQFITNWEAVARLHQEEAINDNIVVLGLENSQKHPQFVSLSKIKVVLFSSVTALRDCLDRKLDNSFDIEELNLQALPNNELVSSIEMPVLTLPMRTDKSEFEHNMADVDALIALAHYNLVNTQLDIQELMKTNWREQTLEWLLPIDLGDSNLPLAKDFFKLCVTFNITRGWDLQSLIETFETNSSNESKSSKLFTQWVRKAYQIANGEDVQVNFTDDEQNQILRAMTLVLYNPEQKQIQAFKQNQGDHVGERVYELASAFTAARTGYSSLTKTERNLVGQNRMQLQDLNAWLHNPTNEIREQVIQSTKTTFVDVTDSKEQINLAEHDFLIAEPDNELKRCSVYRMVGVRPMSGFDLALLEQEDSRLALRIIDMTDEKGRKKLTNKLAMDLIKLQKTLPSTECRFEVDEEFAVNLILPCEWGEDTDLKQHLSQLLEVMKPLKLEQQKSKLI